MKAMIICIIGGGAFSAWFALHSRMAQKSVVSPESVAVQERDVAVTVGERLLPSDQAETVLRFGDTFTSSVNVTAGEGDQKRILMESDGFNLVSFKGKQRAKLESGTAVQAYGAPSLDTLVYSFEGRPGFSAQVDLGELTYDTYEDIDLSPVDDQGVGGDPEIYGVDAFLARRSG